MALNSGLSTSRAVGSILLCEIKVDEWRTTSGGAYALNYYRLADKIGTISVPGIGYSFYGLGQLLSITSSASEIRPSSNDVTVTLSGLTNSALQEFVYSKIKGSQVKIWRGFPAFTTGSDINFVIPAGFPGGVDPNPMLRFQGFVNNIQFEEQWDTDSRTSSNTIILNCSSTVDILQNKISGRRTNPESHKKFYSSDVSMDRVPNLETAFFDFGAKK